MRHPLLGLTRGRTTANVPVLIGGIGADDQKVVAGLDPAMSGSDWQEDDVACFDLHLPPVWTSEHEARPTVDKSERLMRG